MSVYRYIGVVCCTFFYFDARPFLPPDLNQSFLGLIKVTLKNCRHFKGPGDWIDLPPCGYSKANFDFLFVYLFMFRLRSYWLNVIDRK